MENVIEISNLEKCYDGRSVLRNIDLMIKQGEVHAILGKNGAGKSTLFKILAGLTPMTNGSVSIFSQTPTDMAVRSQVGFAINEPVFYEHLSAAENLGIHAGYYNVPSSALVPALQNVGIDPDDQRPIREYSLGMRQRVSIARMLLHQPRLLIIDEPLNGLDPKAIRDFRELLEKLREAGTTILLSSHILSEVKNVATTISILSGGEIVASKAMADWSDSDPTNFEDQMIRLMEENLC